MKESPSVSATYTACERNFCKRNCEKNQDKLLLFRLSAPEANRILKESRWTNPKFGRNLDGSYKIPCDSWEKAQMSLASTVTTLNPRPYQLTHWIFTCHGDSSTSSPSKHRGTERCHQDRNRRDPPADVSASGREGPVSSECCMGRNGCHVKMASRRHGLP